LISALIALTHACAFVEMLSQRLLYPIFFATRLRQISRNASDHAARTWLFVDRCVVACPIISLLLLIVAPHPSGTESIVRDGGGGDQHCLRARSAAVLLGYFVVTPVEALRVAAQKVARGDLETRVDLMRSDEFGPLASQFNHMSASCGEAARGRDFRPSCWTRNGAGDPRA